MHIKMTKDSNTKSANNV